MYLSSESVYSDVFLPVKFFTETSIFDNYYDLHNFIDC